MAQSKLRKSPDEKRDAMNLDYRILGLLLTCATRDDLLDDYINNKDDKLSELGFPKDLLEESRYLFQDPDTQKACLQMQRVMQTLTNLNDYCITECPTDPIVSQLASYTALQVQPLQRAGVEG